MIDYDSLVLQTWDTAKVRSKLHILFVFFEHLDGRPKSEFPIRRVLMWKPDERTDAFLRADWERVNAKVRHGLAHQLSESDGRIMGPCTKGVDASHLRTQPFSAEKARSRAFALKPSFTLQLYRDAERRAMTSIAPVLEMSEPASFEEQLRARFDRYVGRDASETSETSSACRGATPTRATRHRLPAVSSVPRASRHRSVSSRRWA